MDNNLTSIEDLLSSEDGLDLAFRFARVLDEHEIEQAMDEYAESFDPCVPFDWELDLPEEFWL